MLGDLSLPPQNPQRGSWVLTPVLAGEGHAMVEAYYTDWQFPGQLVTSRITENSWLKYEEESHPNSSEGKGTCSTNLRTKFDPQKLQ